MRPKIEDVVAEYSEIEGIHEACLAVPDTSDDELQEICESVAASGLRHEIVLTSERKLLDGRNRLIACYMARVEPRFTISDSDPWRVAYEENVARRHLDTFQRGKFALRWREHEEQAARERLGHNQHTSSVERFPPSDTGKTRDKLGARVGVSGRTIDKIAAIVEQPDIAAKVEAGESSIEAGYKEAKQRAKAAESFPVEADKQKPSQETTKIVTASGEWSVITLPNRVVFNQTNDSVDWARWTWNPVTGCEHGCKFCYAREIANSERMKAYYPNGFEPTFHEYRLSAPANTSKPNSDDPRDGRVFVCSMADLFGTWVPQDWIEKVFDACLGSPEWEYMFLTKWPARYSKLPLIEGAWYGASVVQQADVTRVTAAMSKIDGDVTRWVSLEPMLGPVKFADLGWCDLMVIGSQTSTNQPDGFVPAFPAKFDWVASVVRQCRDAGVPVYLKANLVSSPGMDMPKELPRGK